VYIDHIRCSAVDEFLFPYIRIFEYGGLNGRPVDALHWIRPADYILVKRKKTKNGLRMKRYVCIYKHKMRCIRVSEECGEQASTSSRDQAVIRYVLHLMPYAHIF